MTNYYPPIQRFVRSREMKFAKCWAGWVCDQYNEMNMIANINENLKTCELIHRSMIHSGKQLQ